MLRYAATWLSPTIEQTLIHGRLSLLSGKPDCRGSMVYDRHSRATRGFALPSACLMKGRELLFIFIIMRCHPIALPGD